MVRSRRVSGGVHGRSVGVERIGVPSREPVEFFPDRDLTFHRDGLRWTFDGSRIRLQGYEVGSIISQGDEDISTCLGIAEGLTEYRKKAGRAARAIDQFSKFDAVVEALLGKILGKMKRIYDHKTTGISWEMEDGQLVLNGINVRKFLMLYRLRKTDRARQFLKGLQQKLGIVLENREKNPRYERIREMVEKLYNEIKEELDSDASARMARYLPPGRNRDS